MDIKKIAAVFTACSLVMSIPVFNIFAEDSFKTETISGSGDENEIEIEDNTENTPEPIVTQQPNETDAETHNQSFKENWEELVEGLKD